MSSDPPEPTFASPTPPGALPADGLADSALPDPAAAPATAAPTGTGSSPRAPRPRRRRATVVLASAAAVLAVAAVGTAVGVQAARERAWEPVPADPSTATGANAVQLVLGSCVEELPPDGPVERVRVVPCGDAHEAQVVGRRDSSPEATWPGADGAAAYASAGCGHLLLGPGGRERADGVSFVVWTPSEESWADGDRAGLCLAVHDEPATGSLLD